MGSIVVFENVSLDGATQDATGEEGLNRDDWRGLLSPADRAEWNRVLLEDALRAEVLLLGRRSYDFFAARYPARTGALADRMNGLPKYVVSTTLQDPAWNNSTVLDGDVLAAVSTLKRTIPGEIRVYASTQLVHTLLSHNLVDELRLAVFPLVMGAGSRLFDQSSAPKPLRPKLLRLAETRAVGGMVHLTYRSA